LNLTLAPGERVLAEPGAMMTLTEGISSGIDCADPCARCLAGEVRAHRAAPLRCERSTELSI
jgi:uncharacterized protein (AIM24 family)